MFNLFWCPKVIQAGRFDQKTTADERRRILEELLAKDEVCMHSCLQNDMARLVGIIGTSIQLLSSSPPFTLNLNVSGQERGAGRAGHLGGN